MLRIYYHKLIFDGNLGMMLFKTETNAGVAELVDARDSKSRGAIHEGSIPSLGTMNKTQTNFSKFVWVLFH